jgi:hypothetical protein
VFDQVVQYIERFRGERYTLLCAPQTMVYGIKSKWLEYFHLRLSIIQRSLAEPRCLLSYCTNPVVLGVNEQDWRRDVVNGGQQPRSQLGRAIKTIAGPGEDYDRSPVRFALGQ